MRKHTITRGVKSRTAVKGKNQSKKEIAAAKARFRKKFDRINSSIGVKSVEASGKGIKEESLDVDTMRREAAIERIKRIRRK